jgi:crotonobetainyl-CoA:carnitine CoA-transferase CaiB-like acyl-CoA transferase
MMPPAPAGPLDGVTVLDLCSYLAAPTAARSSPIWAPS